MCSRYSPATLTAVLCQRLEPTEGPGFSRLADFFCLLANLKTGHFILPLDCI
jgi:hypothetical protein